MPPKLRRILRLTSLAEEERMRPSLRYWLTRPPAERVVAVEYLRRQFDGAGARLRRVHRVLDPDCPWGEFVILVRPSLENAARVLEALEAFGFPVPDLSPEAIADRRRMLEMGVPPVQIHLMSAISGVEWDEAWSDRVEGTLGRNRVSFLGRETFIRNKRRRRPTEGSRRISTRSNSGDEVARQ